MTATVNPPATNPTRPKTGATKPTLRLPAELSLWLVTAAAALSFTRLFVDSSYLPPVLLATILSHVLAAALRRKRVPVAFAAAISLVAMLAVCTWLFYYHTTRLGVPTGLSWDTFTADLREAVDRFREDRAPVEPVRGFVAGSAIGFWLVAFLGDWSAFRLWAPVEATVPAGSLFVFASLLGADRSRTFVTAVFFLAAVGFLLLHRMARLEMSPSWVRGDGRRGARAQLAFGGVITVVALLAVAVVGPLLPGADSEALLDVKDIGNDGDTRITVSPLVDIRQRLVEQRDIEVFTVTSPVHSYWRLTALDEFDGRTWRSSKRFEEVTGSLPRSTPGGGSFTEARQTFTVSNLSQIWLPAAYQATSIDAGNRTVRWDRTTGTLIVDQETSDGMEYEVTSTVADHSADTLRAAIGPIPADISKEFLDLPRRFPGSVSDLASQLTAGLPTSYDKAMALQNYFRDNYTYSTENTGGQGSADIADFVNSDLKAGYCEQFSGSFAAMARSIGLPARVAVGFTLGDPVDDPERPDTYVVKGRHAHAWPEVYFSGVGWVLFEPTPGRGSPNASYTNTSEQQDSDIAPNGSTTTTAPTDSTLDPATDLPFDEFPTGGVAPEELPGSETTSPASRAVNSTGAKVVLVLLGLLCVYLVAVPLLHRLRRSRRRSKASHPNDRIDVAWQESTEALRLLDVRPAVGETPVEFAVRADNRSRAGTQIQELAELTTVARYGADISDAQDVERATVLAQGVAQAVHEQTTVGERLQAELDPRPTLRRWWRGLTQARRADDDTDEPTRELVGAGRKD